MSGYEWSERMRVVMSVRISERMRVLRLSVCIGRICLVDER